MKVELIANERVLLYHLYYDIGLDLGYSVLFDHCVQYQQLIGVSSTNCSISASNF